ncbi:MAG: CYTH domain-containing protein [Candidatus Dojkabacteria bacterium]|nr:MAG: CYTH domain-containing protein [Candidatus Dojkabacteria bacterium]
MIEVEKRSLVTQQQLDTHPLKNFFSEKATLQKHFRRFTMVGIENADFTPNPDSLIDLKVRTTEEKGLLTVKYGNWHTGTAREEHEISFNPETEITAVMNILRLLGRQTFIISYLERFEYHFENIIITKDVYKSMPGSILLELEVGVQNENEVESAEKKIDNLMAELQLETLDSEGTKRFIADMNAIKEYQVSFVSQSVDEWYTKWSDYIHCRI